jgi:cytochrome b subunit of formate dehydrogenase
MSEDKETMQENPQIPRRFTVPQRIEHFVLAVSFTLLGLTGIIQKYAFATVSSRMIEMLGGIEKTRIIHRSAAVIFSLLAVYHVIAVLYKLFVHRVKMTMMPVPKDVADAWNLIRHNLFLKRESPLMPRYNFGEKLEYWALIWGGVIMVVTGFMLWNPLIITRFLPGQFIPAAKAAHGGEAVLAVLAIVIWHFYNVHIKTFNTSMFTGRLTKHQMEEEHGEEWRQLREEKGRLASMPSVIRRRRIIFVPIAIVIAAAGAGSIYWGATAEKTAISTVPAPLLKAPISNPPIRPSESAEALMAVSAPRIPHPIQGQERCYQCHGASGMKPVPENHIGRPEESCRICHRPAPTPPPSAKTGKTGAEKAARSGPRPIPHPADKAPYKDCTNCHGIGKMKPFPENHATFSIESCAACHKAASTATPAPAPAPKIESASEEKTQNGGPKPIPHPTDKAPYKDCANCHGIGKMKPFPAYHEAFPIEGCAACHK